MFSGILAVAGLIFLMEIGDKTGLLVIALSSRSNKQFTIFFGALSALSVMAFIGAALGYLLEMFVENRVLLNVIVGLIFIATGIIMLVKSEDLDVPLENQQDTSRSSLAWFLKTFFLVGSAEFLDKTQLTIIALIPLNGFATTMFGAILGFALITLLEILLGDSLRRHLPETWIHYGTVLIFVLTGVIIIVLQFI